MIFQKRGGRAGGVVPELSYELSPYWEDKIVEILVEAELPQGFALLRTVTATLPDHKVG